MTAAGLILEFNKVGASPYEAVSSKLGVDMKSGEGDWPAGRRRHPAFQLETAARVAWVSPLAYHTP